jgi:protein gp37
MNKTKIEWTDYSWNPITGCEHGCWYCYANKLFTRFHRSFKPTFHPERLLEVRLLKKSAKIFVCSVSDLFAPWIPEEWRDEVLAEVICSEIPHTFQLLTKNPERIPRDLAFPENVWIGTTVTGEGDDWKNIEAMRSVRANRFVSFEPLLGELDFSLHPLDEIDWVIVGKLTGSKKVKLKFSWLASIMDETARVGIPLFMKNNLRQSFPNLRLLQEFPEEGRGATQK